MFLREEIAPRQMKLIESVQGDSNSACLGTMYGPCADYKNPTRNQNFYGKKLWENVFNDEIIKESLQDRILIGELDHPETRLETKATNACIVMTDYEFHDDEGLLYGKFDILPTPNGRILKSLLDCGCRIGVSSRGEGNVEEVTNDDGSITNMVDEDDYEFVAFDAVVLPAVKAAKPSLQESFNHVSLHESLQKEVESATTLSELDLIKNVVEATNLPESGSILESVKNKSQELSNGTTSSSVIIEDLEKSNETIQELKREIESLKLDVTTSKSKYMSQIKSRQKLVNESKKLKDDIAYLQESYNDLNQSTSSELNKLNNLVEKLNTKIDNLSTENEVLNEQLDSYFNQLQITEKSLNESQKFSKSKVDEVNKLKSDIKKLSDQSTKKLTESSNRHNKLKENYDKIKTQLAKSNSEIKKLKESYIKMKSSLYGIDSQVILDSIKESMTISDIDKIINNQVDKMHRYNSLSFTDDHIIDLLQESKIRLSEGQIQEDKEINQTIKFMEEANKLF